MCHVGVRRVMRYDIHVHSQYSDGADMESMIQAAEEVELDGVGFADHCNVSKPEAREDMGFDLHETYERRREDIEQFREEYDIEIFDAVEMDYYSGSEDEIRTFLREANFDYTIGSVHHMGTDHIMEPETFTDYSDEEKQETVDRYFELLTSLVASELFDVAAHVDVVERNAELRGLATEAHYRHIADAFVESDTVPEINAGRVFDDYGKVHPHPDLLDILLDEDVRFVLGSDSHTPAELRERSPYLSDLIGERNITPYQL